MSAHEPARASALKSIRAFGQSVWLDDLGRELLTSGTLERLVEEDGVSGVTSNPSIFRKSITHGGHYDRDIERLARRGLDATAIYRDLTLRDVGDAADLLRPYYDASGGADGYVSLEVSPKLARDPEATVNEARELWRALGRPNVLIKVPATAGGLTAIRRLVAEGINVNATLLFDVGRYVELAEAYRAGLEDRLAAGQPVNGVASVASFFLSRIDTAVDAALEEIARAGGERGRAAAALAGRTAIACARRAYGQYLAMTSEARWSALAARGARAQRLLWASTGTKNPAYSDLHYVEPLIGAQTINTMPLETLAAYRAHGRPSARLPAGAAESESVLAGLAALGVDLAAVTRRLEEEGVQKFVDAYEELRAAIETKRAQAAARAGTRA